MNITIPATTTIESPYHQYIESCRECLIACQHFYAKAPIDFPFRAHFETLVATLKQAILLMEKKNRFTPRYLVDCAELCELCAKRCQRSSHKLWTYAAETCLKGMRVCRRASMVVA